MVVSGGQSLHQTNMLRIYYFITEKEKAVTCCMQLVSESVVTPFRINSGI